MSIIRGEKVEDIAILTPTKELFFSENNLGNCDLFEEECRKAFQKGQEKGEKIGYEKGCQEGKVFIDLLRTMSRKVLEHKKRLLDQLKPEVIEFAITTCERILRKELTQPEVMVKLINSLLTIAATNKETLRIVLSPEDLVLLEKHLKHIQYDKKEIEGVSFVSEPLMRRGDCRIETKAGLLNYDIGRELSNLQSKVLQNE